MMEQGEPKEKESLNDWLSRLAEEEERRYWADLRANGHYSEFGE
jgi:hypothetical protein